MQSEIKRKTMAYGIAAVLLAVLLTGVAYVFVSQPYIQPEFSQLRTFSSYDELRDFLRAGMEQGKLFRGSNVFPTVASDQFEALTQSVKTTAEHSSTNVQVAGVDEADTVKTDGTCLYVVSGSNVYILKVYPPQEVALLSKITLNQTYNIEIYVVEDRLAVLGNHQPIYYVLAKTESFAPYMYNEESFVKIYDITERANPILTRTVAWNGSLTGSRMIGDYVYGVINQPAIKPGSNETNLDIVLPSFTLNDVVKEVQPTEIRYVNVSDTLYYFTTIASINVINDTQEPTYETFLASASSTMYVSQNNMYLTTPNTNVWIMPLQAGEPREETLIYRIKLDNEKITAEAQGNVPGYVLNQFSMDEHNGYFRIATTKGWGDIAVNNLYVLNMSLNTVGKLEGLAQGERIYSARFMADRCYLVTFRQIDPFFVVDLSNPLEPKVLGFLKIPGFSGYLNPYDENLIIGVGKQDNMVKLSLFDVKNVTAPVEAVPPYIVEGAWSDTSVLWDHKSFLFDKSKQLLALPVSINWVEIIDETYYNKGFWQGEYIFKLSVTDGFVLKGNITHQEAGTEQWDMSLWVKRSLYIDDVLYTVSDKKVKMNSLIDLGFIGEVELS